MTQKKKVWLIALFMFWLGYEVKDNRVFPLSHFYKRHFVDHPEPKKTKSQQQYAVYADINARKRVDCPAPQNAEVVVTFGQSNAANSGGHRYTNQDPRILNFFDGHCYVASDPMLGASADRGSLWIPFAQAYKSDKTLVFVTFAVGATRLDQWADPDDLGKHFKHNMSSLKQAGLSPDLFLWVQGESDHASDVSVYERSLDEYLSGIATEFPESRLALSGTSYCASNSSKALVRAQRKVAQNRDFIWLGVTDDIVGSEYRYDNCHFSKYGMDKVAKRFAESLK